MKNTVVILDGTFENDYASYKSVVKDKAQNISSLIDASFIFIEEGLEKCGAKEYIIDLYNKTEGFEDIVYISTDMPLVDALETKKMFDMHKGSFAMYTYGENYPLGIVPFIIKRGALERLIKLSEDRQIPITKNVIHDAVFLEPNFFEIEILISKHDMRYYRLTLLSDSKANNILVSSLLKYGSYDEIAIALKENVMIRRTLPVYVEIEITGKNNVVKNIFPNESGEDKSMTTGDFEKIYNNLTDYAAEIHLSIGGRNEPFLNENIFGILEKALSSKKTKIYLETNALLLTKDNAAKLINFQNENDNLYVIIHLDAVKQSVYDKIYKTGDLQTILSNIEYYFLRMPKNTYLQIIKQKDNFNYLSDYYKYFEKYNATIIMQKYATYRGKVLDNKVGDLTPVVKLCCWHLLRDMYIDVDGNVPLCAYDIDKEIKLGNVLSEGVEGVWKKGGSFYKDNAEGSLEFCKNCDEWYLYNF